MALRQRLLRDITELEKNPYPNITFVPYASDVTTACLILTPNGGNPLHLTVKFGDSYPLKPPVITIQSRVQHPNVFGDYICASILNTDEGYTPAYDLKGIVIQILSFFSSDSIEQSYGGVADLRPYQQRSTLTSLFRRSVRYDCPKCGLNGNTTIQDPARQLRQPAGLVTRAAPAAGFHCQASAPDNEQTRPIDIHSLPDELLCAICSFLQTEELMVFAKTWNRIGSNRGVVTKFNLIRNRELQCFCLKKSFEEVQLGVGVNTTGQMHARKGTLSSEFDLLSLPAFSQFAIRKSVHSLAFQHRLPLPLSRKHYNTVKDELTPRLNIIRDAARLNGVRAVDTIFSFMSDIVVKLSTDSQSYDRSSLGRASEKAIDSYYHLFHLLLCLAVEDPSIVRTTNQTLQGVLNGRTSKQDMPNLGHLLISILISDADMTRDLLLAIIRETVIRNVVWMLEPGKGKGMVELAYMEADAVSNYRLEKTYEAGRTSYRLLMFLNLFRQIINRGTGQNRRSLSTMRDELFDSHGAPPPGTATRLAEAIRTLADVDSFPKFLVRMDLHPPAASQFTTFLRNCMEESVRKGYSVWGIKQERTLVRRRQVDPDVQIRDDPSSEWKGPGTFQVTFFPNRARGGGGGGRGGGRGARGRGVGGRG